MVHGFNSSTKEAEAGRYLSLSLSQPGLQREFYVSQDCKERPCLRMII